jgi:hypothetical protein
MKRSRTLLLALLLCVVSSIRAGDTRYVIVTKTIELRFNRYPLWEPMSGNKIGKLNVGTETGFSTPRSVARVWSECVPCREV